MNPGLRQLKSAEVSRNPNLEIRVLVPGNMRFAICGVNELPPLFEKRLCVTSLPVRSSNRRAIFLARTPTIRNLSHLLGVVVAAVVIATLFLAKAVLVPFALAMLLGFLLTPVVMHLERLRFPRGVAVAFVVILFIAAMGSIGWGVTNQLLSVTSQLTDYKTNIENKIESVRGLKGHGLNKASDAVKELSQELGAQAPNTPAVERSGKLTTSTSQPIPVEVVPPPTNFLEYASTALGPLGTAAIVVVFMIFILLQREDLRNRFIRLAGQGRLKVMTQALDEAAQRLSRYLLLQFAVNIGYGLTVSVVLHFIGIPNAMLWGVAAGVLRFLPYIGPPLGAALPILLALAVFDGWSKAIFTVGFFLALEIAVSNFVEPHLYGSHTGISPLAILFAATFWTLIWGPIGLVLSTPLTVCLVVMGRHVPHLEFLQIILGDEPVLTPEKLFYQRLLATDQIEARQIMETYLKDRSLTELFDSVLIPALSLAEQDRHRDELDEVTELFIAQSVKELVEEANDRADELFKLGSDAPDDPLAANNLAGARESYIVCLPARDEADEIVGTMLAHLLERAGYRAHYLEIGTFGEMLAHVAEQKPGIVCLSALPPFALSHARRIYGALQRQFPDLKIVVGLWNGSSDTSREAIRISGIDDNQVSRSLAQSVLQVKLLIEATTPAPPAPTSAN